MHRILTSVVNLKFGLMSRIYLPNNCTYYKMFEVGTIQVESHTTGKVNAPRMFQNTHTDSIELCFL